ncbi:MAG: hypothetical protein CM15mV5_0460 [uncultured marine virus]|nr:MAG: hypothetical protein CM15mV5_0460 [uncultured marine virus]
MTKQHIQDLLHSNNHMLVVVQFLTNCQNLGSNLDITAFEYGCMAPDNIGVARVTVDADHG